MVRQTTGCPIIHQFSNTLLFFVRDHLFVLEDDDDDEGSLRTPTGDQYVISVMATITVLQQLMFPAFAFQ